MQVPSVLLQATNSVRNRACSTFYTETVDGERSLDKFKIALMLGIPVVLGVGCITYFYFRKPKLQKIAADAEKRSGASNAKAGAESSSTPFSQAMNAKDRGNKLFKSGKFEKAIECYTQAISLCPSNKTDELATFHQNRAAANEALKNYETVLVDCSTAIDLKRDYIKAWQRRAKANEELGNLQEALNDITAACILEQFQNQNSILMTDKLLRQHSKNKAKSFINSRTPTMPSNHFVRHYFMSYVKHPVIDRPPNGDELKLLLEQLTEAGEFANREEKVSLIKGTIHILEGDIRNGEIEFEKVLNSEASEKELKVNALIKLGTIKVHDVDGGTDGIQKAMECFDAAIRFDENNPDIYLHRAQIYLLAEQIDEAKSDLDKCCSLSPSFPSAIAQRLYVRYRCAVRYNDEDTVKKLMKEFKVTINKFKNSSELHSLYAQALMEQQEFQEADEHFLKAIECDPEDANLLVHRAILLIQSTNNLDNAVELIEKALQTDNKCQFAYEMLGTIEVQRGNLKKGIECFDGALAVAQTEIDCAHLFSLREAALAQSKAIQSLGISPVIP